MPFDIVLPPEIWERILGFLKPDEEFMSAMVCRDFYAILEAKQLKRGAYKWYTDITPYCDIPRRANAVWETVTYYDRFVICRKIMDVAAKKGYADTLIYYIKFGKGFCNPFIAKLSGHDEYHIALKHKQYDCIRAMVMQGIPVPEDFGNDVVKSGQLDLIKLTLHKQYIGVMTLHDAIDTCNIEIIKYIFELCPDSIPMHNTNSVWLQAIHKHRLDIIQYLHDEQKLKLTDELMQSACLMHCWDIVEYLISNMCPIHIFNYDKLQLDNPDLAGKVNPATIIPDEPILSIKNPAPTAWAWM